MAEEEKKQNEEPKQEKSATKTDLPQDEKKGSLLQWIIMIIIIVVPAVAGLFIGDIIGSGTQPAGASETDANADNLSGDMLAEGSTKGWYYDLDPVATNLSDPGSTRYVRAVLTLEMLPEADEAQGRAFLDTQKPVISNILNIYFAGLTIEDINSDKDMRRIQYELVEIFNDSFYKNSKPLVKQILFREFGLQ
jgi:flagellar basal body-associated protein FliL